MESTASVDVPRGPGFPFQDFASRAADLVSRLTLEEKVGQMIYSAAGVERLSIPEHNWRNECLHSVARAGVAKTIAERDGLAPEEWLKQRAQDCPLKRFATTEEIAGVVTFLASPDAAYINGKAIEVGGGMVMS